MHITANILIALLFATGLYVQFSQSWNALYRANIIFHPAFGTVATLVLLWHYARHAKERSGVKLNTFGFLAFSVAGGVLAAFWPQPFLLVATVACIAVFVISARRLAGGETRARVVAVGWQSVYVLLILCLFTGAALLPMQGMARAPWLFAFHRYISYATVVVFIVCLIWPMLRRGGDGFYLRRALPAMVSTLVGITALFLLIRAEKQNIGPVYTASLSTIPIQNRAPEDLFPPPPGREIADLVQMSESCATNPGCHQQEMVDFKFSNHNLSGGTPYFQKNLAMLAEEAGPENVKLCAGCHYPYMMLSGDLDYKRYTKINNFSCVYCHQIGTVRKHATDRRISYLTVEPNVAHLKMFHNKNGNPRISRWNELLVKMNPAAHGRVFTRPLYFQDEYCQACHALQIQTPKFTGLQRNTCIRCHMQPRSYLGYEGKKMNHFFPGATPSIAYSLGHDKIVKLIQAWVRGDISSSSPDVNFWKLRRHGAERSERAFWLFMNVEPMTRPRAGSDLEFDIITTNTGIDHQFPSAPLDLVEAWLQVTVRDARGEILYSIGKLDDTYRLPEDYPQEHRLGGYMLDSSDHLLIQNRVWDIKKKVVLRNIMPYESAKDRIRFSVPEDARGPLRVQAQWNYRAQNQDFADWAYEDVDLGGRPKRIPHTVVGYIDTKIPLATSKSRTAHR